MGAFAETKSSRRFDATTASFRIEYTILNYRLTADGAPKFRRPPVCSGLIAYLRGGIRCDICMAGNSV